MTKVIILGEATPEQTKKPIEFIQYLNDKFILETMNYKPKSFEYIELICKNYSNGLDLMFAYDMSRTNGYLVLGHFNDGVVE